MTVCVTYTKSSTKVNLAVNARNGHTRDCGYQKGQQLSVLENGWGQMGGGKISDLAKNLTVPSLIRKDIILRLPDLRPV